MDKQTIVRTAASAVAVVVLGGAVLLAPRYNPSTPGDTLQREYGNTAISAQTAVVVTRVPGGGSTPPSTPEPAPTVEAADASNAGTGSTTGFSMPLAPTSTPLPDDYAVPGYKGAGANVEPTNPPPVVIPTKQP